MIIQQRELKQLIETLQQARKRAVIGCDEKLLTMIDTALCRLVGRLLPLARVGKPAAGQRSLRRTAVSHERR